MKNKKQKSVILLNLFLILKVLFACPYSEGGDKLQVKIWIDKGEFMIHEPIPVHYEAKNVSDSTIYLNFEMIEEDFVIQDGKGKHYHSHIRGTYGGGQPFAPGDIHKESLDIGSRYGVNGVGQYICYIHSYPFFAPNSQFLNSNTIEFKVLEPKGEEKEALRFFLEAEKLKYARSVAGGPDFAKKELGFLKYQELVDKYPKSIYAPKALSAAVGVYLYSPKPEEKRRIIPVCIKAIEDYPDSYYFVLAFTDLELTYENLKDKEGAIKTMQELMEKHPNTKISEEAERRLTEIEKWEFK